MGKGVGEKNLVVNEASQDLRGRDGDASFKELDLTMIEEEEDVAFYEGGELPLLSSRRTIVDYVLAVLVSIGLMLFSTMQIVSFKRLGYAFEPYPYFILLSVSFMFVPIYFTGMFFVYMTTGGFVPETTTLWFKRHFVIIGFCNAMNGVLLIFAVPYTPGTIQAIFTQAIIPFVMIISVVTLKTRYTIFQYVGAVVIVVGVLVTLVPQFTNAEEGDVESTGGLGFDVIWWFVFMFGMFPLAAQSVYQEHAFRKAKVNVVYMMAWASLSQFIVLCLCFPVNFVPKFGGIPPGDFGLYFRDAAYCLAATDSSIPECDQALLWLMLSMLGMLGAQFFQALVIKYTTATLSVLLMTAVVPLSAICFTFSWIMGPYTETLTPWLWVSLVLVVAGVLTYRFVNWGRWPFKLCRKSKDKEIHFRTMDAIRSQGASATERSASDSDGDDDAEPFLNATARVGIIDIDVTTGNSAAHDLIYGNTLPIAARTSSEHRLVLPKTNDSDDEHMASAYGSVP
eukprot:CAMPEP_0119127852 /NCGR_PEP_ID=MMETSP1310-20130426/6237_1 /TAXON_ID=464262 /ORGANISM="Genus nov. species nov., Strain RCC2339" /LENGTH=508 /DNA_ID=CAMNT_0007118135 /DNA_START=538 /DNA_END=2064 /DNA_ORIENTATION=-